MDLLSPPEDPIQTQSTDEIMKNSIFLYSQQIIKESCLLERIQQSALVYWEFDSDISLV